jgi:NAD(P)-dependent dehydrogenase (short-subunit alcohol dehydrogenase family)
MRDIEIDLSGRTFRLIGEPGPVADAIAAALAANGGRAATGDGPADVLVAIHPLLPADERPPVPATAGLLPQVTAQGRMVVVLSALASLPARRHLDYSAAMAAALAEVRALAMAQGPHRLVNAVGVGAIADRGEELAGTPEMVGHTAVGRAGSLDDVVGAVLFLTDPANTYTTGQILNVDGGWSAGYGRNF